MSVDPANPFGYGDEVWRRFQSPRHAGALAGGVRGEAGTPASHGRLRLDLRIEGGCVAAACFAAYGCPVTIAVGDWLAEAAVGRPVTALRALDAAAIRAALEIPETKAHCALLGEDAVRAVLARLS